MVFRCETFRNDKGIVVLQLVKVSLLSIISNRFYESPKLKNWMCELCTFSQIRSQLCTESDITTWTSESHCYMYHFVWADQREKQGYKFDVIHITCNMCSRDLPDMYALGRPSGFGHTYQANPLCPCYNYYM